MSLVNDLALKAAARLSTLTFHGAPIAEDRVVDVITGALREAVDEAEKEAVWFADHARSNGVSAVLIADSIVAAIKRLKG